MRRRWATGTNDEQSMASARWKMFSKKWSCGQLRFLKWINVHWCWKFIHGGWWMSVPLNVGALGRGDYTVLNLLRLCRPLHTPHLKLWRWGPWCCQHRLTFGLALVNQDFMCRRRRQRARLLKIEIQGSVLLSTKWPIIVSDRRYLPLPCQSWLYIGCSHRHNWWWWPTRR